jgi:hypothetical protein
MADIACLSMETYFQRRQLAHPTLKNEVDSIDLYKLPRCDLSRYIGLVVPGLADQEFLLEQRHLIRAWLDAGGVLAFSGQLFRPWLPGGRPFVPTTVRSFRDYAVRIVCSHPVFDGVTDDDLTFRKGVAGFFARGHHPVPEGAEVLVRLSGGEPVVYIDRVTTAGTMFVHAGNDIFGYADAEGRCARLVPQLLAWMRTESANRRTRVV